MHNSQHHSLFFPPMFLIKQITLLCELQFQGSDCVSSTAVSEGPQHAHKRPGDEKLDPFSLTGVFAHIAVMISSLCLYAAVRVHENMVGNMQLHNRQKAHHK